MASSSSLSSSSSYIQIYNADQDPVFLDVNTGNLLWILPKKIDIKNVLYVTHIADNGHYYYENTSNGEVTWQLPAFPSVSPESIKSIRETKRSGCEEKIKKPYDGQATINQINALDTYLDNKETFQFEEEEEVPARLSVDDDQSEDGSRTSTISRSSMKAMDVVKKNVVKVSLPLSPSLSPALDS